MEVNNNNNNIENKPKYQLYFIEPVKSNNVDVAIKAIIKEDYKNELVHSRKKFNHEIKIFKKYMSNDQIQDEKQIIKPIYYATYFIDKVKQFSIVYAFSQIKDIKDSRCFSYTLHIKETTTKKVENKTVLIDKFKNYQSESSIFDSLYRYAIDYYNHLEHIKHDME